MERKGLSAVTDGLDLLTFRFCLDTFSLSSPKCIVFVVVLLYFTRQLSLKTIELWAP